MEISDVELGNLVTVMVGNQIKRGIIAGRRIGGRTEGLIDESTFPGMDVVQVALEHIGVPPEIIAITCLPDEVEKTIPLTDIDIGRDYLMQDGRGLRIMREWTAEDGHIRLEVLETEEVSKGTFTCSKMQFLALTLMEQKDRRRRNNSGKAV